MSMIGIFGGMGPAATVDFIGKLVSLTPAKRDQDHLPLLVANLPHIPDRSSAILGQGPDPLPALYKGIDLLNSMQVGVVVIPCNSSHYWFPQMCARSRAPLLHIAHASVQALVKQNRKRVLILATRGTLAAGFYQREIELAGLQWTLPEPTHAQAFVDACIRAVKAGDPVLGGDMLKQAIEHCADPQVDSLLMACTEIPIAALHAPTQGMALIDTSLELARAAVDYGMSRHWNIGP